MKYLGNFVALASASLIAFSGTAMGGDGQLAGNQTTRVLIKRACGSLPNMKVAASNTGQNTTSTTFVDVTGASLLFTHDGTSPRCALVTFSIQGFACCQGQILRVRAMLDKIVPAFGDPIQMVAQGGTISDAHTYTFLFPSVSPGSHEIKMQYSAQLGASNVSINDYTMVLQHP